MQFYYFFFFGEISKTFCKVKYRALPAIMQNQFVSFLSSDTETKPTHLIYKMYWLGLLPGWFPASLASFHVFLPMRHMKTTLFCFVLFFNASRCDSLGEPAPAWDVLELRHMCPAALLLHGNCSASCVCRVQTVRFQTESCLQCVQHPSELLCNSSRPLHTKLSFAKTISTVIPHGWKSQTPIPKNNLALSRHEAEDTQQ